MLGDHGIGQRGAAARGAPSTFGLFLLKLVGEPALSLDSLAFARDNDFVQVEAQAGDDFAQTFGLAGWLEVQGEGLRNR